LIRDVELFGRDGTDLAVACLHQLTEKYELTEAVFLVDNYLWLPDSIA